MIFLEKQKWNKKDKEWNDLALHLTLKSHIVLNVQWTMVQQI